MCIKKLQLMIITDKHITDSHYLITVSLLIYERGITDKQPVSYNIML